MARGRRSSGPVALDPVTSRVEEPWTTEPSVYGPFGTLLHGLSALVGGDSLRQGVWVWQVLVVLAWLAVRAAAAARCSPRPARPGRRAVDPQPARPRRRGARRAHRRRRPPPSSSWPWRWRGARGWCGAGLLAGRARRSPARRRSRMPSSAVAVVAAWWVVGHRSAVLARLVGALVAGFVVVAGALHVWAGPHVYDQLVRSRQAVSLAMPWRPVLEWGRDTVGDEPDPARASASLRRCSRWCSRPACCGSAAPPGFPARCGRGSAGGPVTRSIRGRAAGPRRARGGRPVGHRVPGARLLARRALLAALVRPARLVRAARGGAGPRRPRRAGAARRPRASPTCRGACSA